MAALDLYAKIEPLIGFYDEYDGLYATYVGILQTLHVKNILDIGCGNGRLLSRLKHDGYEAFGIDRSPAMVRRAQKLGVSASTQELDDLARGSYDCALCVADVLNYIAPDQLADFFASLYGVLETDGYFLADVNTNAGFNFADGVMIRDEAEQFLAVEAFYEQKVLTTNITLFEQKEQVFQKQSAQILQYYHPKKVFQNIRGFKLLKTHPIRLFGQSSVKSLMLFQKIKEKNE